MRHFISIFVLAVIIAQPTAAHVTLTLPSGGERFSTGSIVSIEWRETQQHNTLNWDVYLSEDNGVTWQQIAFDLPYESRKFLWTVPKFFASLSAKVRVVQDNQTLDYESTSNIFQVAFTTPTDIEKTEANL